MAERIKLGGLWQNKSKDGTDYLSGRLSPTVKILIFKINYKQPGDNSPTHIMYLAPLDPDPNAQRGAEQQPDSFFGGSELNAASDDSGGGDDDFAAAAPARPQAAAPRPAAAGRPNAPAVPAGRPMNAQSTNTRPAQNGAPQGPRRQPTPPAPQPDDIGDFEDPFGE
jgi:hypothetical protein